MANEITPYAPGPGSLANQVVGTPGVNHQVGQEWFKLADAAGQAREGAARNQMSAANQMFGILDGVAGAIGSAIGRHAFAQQKTNNLLNINAVNNKVYDFEDALLVAENSTQQQFANQPQNAQKAFKSLIERNSFNADGTASFSDGEGNPLDISSIMRAARSDQGFKDDPKSLAKLENDLTAAAHRSSQKMLNWSFGQRRTIAEASDDKIIQDTNAKLSLQHGPMADRLANYQSFMSNAENRIASNMEVMGQQHVEKKISQLRKEAGFTYIDAGIANLPEGSADALVHLSQVKAQLEDSGKNGIEIDAKSKLTLQGKIETAENHHMKEITNDSLSNTVLDTAGISTRKAYLDMDSKSAAPQHQAKYWAADQIKVATKSINEIQANPNLDARAKNIIIGRYAQQINQLDGLIEHADSNLKAQDTAARQVESDLRRDASDARRDAADARRITNEEKRLQHEKDLAVKAQLKEQSEETKSGLVSMEDELHQLMTDPVGNRQAIIKKAGEISATADKARNDKHISAEHAARTLKGAVNVVQTAAQYKEKPGFLWMPSTVDRIKPESAQKNDLKELQKRRNQYVSQMETIRRQQAQLRADDNINATIRGMNQEQREEFNKVWPVALAELNSRGFDESQIAQKKNLFINRIFAKMPTQGPKKIPGAPNPPSGKDMVIDTNPQAISGNYKPTGGMKLPPTVMTSNGYESIPRPAMLMELGNLDLSVREKVSFPNGLTEANSTSAARKEVPASAFPKGSYGSEYSTTVTLDDKYVILPTIFNGKLHSTAEAVAEYKRTGKHMGKFANTSEGLKESEEYSQALHKRQQYIAGKPVKGNM